MKIGAIIQARMSSTRLPGKVLKELPLASGISVLQQVIRRVKKAKMVDDVIVATTTKKTDDPIAVVAKEEKIKVFRGSEEDVLLRFYLAAKENKLDYIVRLTADCPCIDPKIIDFVIDDYFKSKVDYISYCYPRGIDIEVIPFKLLEEANSLAIKPADREHVSKFIYESGKYKIKWFEPHDEVFSNIRITLDTPEDYELLRAVFDRLYDKNKFFGQKEILALYQKEPLIFKTNRHIEQTKERGLYK